MIVVSITDQMITQAKVLSDQMGTLNRSIMDGNRNVAGFLGEFCFQQIYPKAYRANCYNYDFVLNGQTVDIKTKVRTVPPKLNFMVSIPEYSNQKVDFYYFVSLLMRDQQYTTAYLLGYMRPAEFKAKAHLLKKGDIDPSNGFVCRESCYDLPISSLHFRQRYYMTASTHD